MEDQKGENKNVLTLKMSPKLHFISLFSLIILLLLSIIFISILGFDIAAIFIIGIVILINAIPTLYLHFEYLMISWKNRFVISKDSILHDKNGSVSEYRFSEITKIELFLSPSLRRGSNFHLASFDGYHFAIIYFNNKKIILTSLLNPRIDLELRRFVGIKVEKKVRLICNITPF